MPNGTCLEHAAAGFRADGEAVHARARVMSAEWVVDRISPRPLLLIAAGNNRLVPPEDWQSLYDKARDPKKLVVLPGVGHYEVYASPAFDQVMDETVAWFRKHLPPQ